jgi:DNA-directed RNA polymerase subunit F
MQIKSSRPVSVSEAKEILAKRKDDGELGYEQNQALENTDRFGDSDAKKAKALIETLSKIDKISTELAIKIVDIRPGNAATLRAILVKDRVELNEDELNNILKELA